MVIMHINYPRFPDRDQHMDIQRYISHMRMDCKLASHLIKGCWILEEIPGAGYPGKSGLDPQPQNLCIGMLMFENMEAFEQFKPYVGPTREDIPKVGNVYAYTNFYELHEVQLPVTLEKWEQDLLDEYVSKA